MQHHSYNTLVKNESSESNHRRTSDKSIPRGILWNSWSVIFKSVKVIKVKESQGTGSDSGELK